MLSETYTLTVGKCSIGHMGARATLAQEKERKICSHTLTIPYILITGGESGKKKLEKMLKGGSEKKNVEKKTFSKQPKKE